ncbi:MAG TPA: NosD domain-containing protein [Gemmatimonadales bacterium]
MSTHSQLRHAATAVAVSIGLLGYARAAVSQGDSLPIVTLRPGLVITRSVRVQPGTYDLPGHSSLDSAVIIIRGNDITVDFAGAIMRGTPPDTDPDRAAGVAIRIDGGRNVRLLRAEVHGYRIGILARGTRGLQLIDNDLSYTWKPRLYSLVEHESLVDWMSFHHNDAREWLRTGAAIYLDDVEGGELRGNLAVQGMNGLLMTKSRHLAVRGNTFAFNSALGIGLYRSSDNTIAHNRVGFNVRGYSHGFYQRGQDSAGILLYEQSSRNIVAYNSVTHGGDGLFLWAGQSTMDSGEGGANDNLFYGNDFSFAPTNSMEATFSRNMFVANRAVGSTYGMWGGYSFESVVVGNCFARNRVGLAIEHGQDNLILANRFSGDSTAVSLWANPSELSDWGYPQHRDTRSRDNRVERNAFVGNRVAVRGVRTHGLLVRNNAWRSVDSVTVLRDSTGFSAEGNVTSSVPLGGGDPCDPMPALPARYAALAPEAGGVAPTPTELDRLDRSAMVVDEWGPFDWRSPKLWPTDSTRAVPLRLRVLGPRGRWALLELRGVEAISATAGAVGDTIAVTPDAESIGDWEVTLEYSGEATVSPRGVRAATGTPYVFSYGRFEPTTDWTVRFFAWDEATHPDSQPAAFDSLLRSMPLFVRHESRLDYEWYRPTIPDLPRERVALEGTAAVTLPAGDYTLRTISDDGVRVWVDGALLIDHWTAHGSELNFARLNGGRHDLRVRYYQDGGWTELRLDIVRGIQQSPGSPGPH